VSDKSVDNVQTPILVKPEDLNPETLQSVLESFITREGTDYGVSELSMEQKTKNLKSQIICGDVVLVFDPNTESLTFLTKAQWKNLAASLG